ncbi:lipA: lipoyl synthase [Rubrobacter radiotolerans]|uniref:Lipoyl synthase n=2 Tax=Rubrobacter radiotolerans TaxID=42256 RepID=A0A023X0U4_RUBRA|nr:lipoyl synthase [Rubrobacter radiotolerans]AHY45684.1 lipA: lipoyl synthase [Rubrobacter radiotolerans]SMC03053.1 lipoic acid synthetase [Rubrobacter radiotolerans DSM 5868]
MTRKKIGVQVLGNGSKAFTMKHSWEGSSVAAPPDGVPTEYLPFKQERGKHGRPDWLKARVPGGEAYREIKETMRGLSLHTVCEEARCPNIGECWNNRTATFMILGNVCTRSCGFCAVLTGKPTELDLDEPRRVADAAKKMGLRHAVITSVNRDEQLDGGAGIFAATIRAIREEVPGCAVEVLTPDFKGRRESVQTVIDARPDTFNHNIETVPRLYPAVRPQAKYRRSLEVLRYAKELNPEGLTKSGFMLGLGEVREEIIQTMQDLRDHDVDILTVGQYLRPSENHLPMVRYATPKEFAEYRKIGFELGFSHVESGPLVRSSYHAHEQTEDARRGLAGVSSGNG